MYKIKICNDENVIEEVSCDNVDNLLQMIKYANREYNGKRMVLTRDEVELYNGLIDF